jgi:VWFA-related protein
MKNFSNLPLYCSSPIFTGALLLASLLTLLPHLRAQSPTLHPSTPATSTPDRSTPDLTMNARTVLIDVVVTGKNDKPITGLHQEDFNIWEDGHPQQITSFEEHPGPNPPPPPTPLPPNVFTNIPRATPAGSPIVLLLDSLNTPLADQTFVRKEMLTYLQHLQPSVPMAIFTLGSQLRFIQGFTDDPALLRSVAQNLHTGSGPETSPLLKTTPETNMEQTAVAQIASSSPRLVQMAVALQQFQAEETASKDSVRALTTLEALQELAHYLAGIPGRKSIVWFSGAFPSYIFPDQTLSNPSAIERGFSSEARRTDAALSAAQIAVYPIAAEGLANNSLYDVETRPAGLPAKEMQQASATSQQPDENARAMQEQAGSSLLNDSVHRNLDHATMDQIAHDTGGKAFYNTNGIDKAIAHVVDNSSNYYTLSYTPTRPAAAGQFRKIKVRLASDRGNLAYRDGYFTPGNTRAQPPDPDADPLVPFMQADVPDSTEIPLALIVQPPAPASPSPATASCPSDNHDLTQPLPCDSVLFIIAAKGLHFDTSPNGARQDTIEVTLLAYNDNGKPLNWIVRHVNLDMDAARYAQVQSNGVHFSLKLAIPKDATTLRGGIYDPSGLAGTLSIPLANVVSVTPPQATPKPH